MASAKELEVAATVERVSRIAGFSGQDMVELDSQLSGPSRPKQMDSRPAVQRPSNEALPTEKI